MVETIVPCPVGGDAFASGRMIPAQSLPQAVPTANESQTPRTAAITCETRMTLTTS
jgi:hypothetical protein